MKKQVITIYECEFCGTKHEDEQWMKMHEEICPLNPKNQPCSTCAKQILGLGCAHGMDMDRISDNVKCFFYKQGIPLNPNNIMKIDGNFDETPPEQ